MKEAQPDLFASVLPKCRDCDFLIAILKNKDWLVVVKFVKI